MKKFIFIIFVCLLIPCIGYAQETSTLATELQEALDKARKELFLIGASTAVITPNEGLWLGVSGLSQRIPLKKVQPEMLFPMASVTKNFTATLILQLAEEGLLDLDDTVGDWLPDLPEEPSQFIDNTITIRQLLNHYSGIYDVFESKPAKIVSRRYPNKIWEPEERISFVESPYASPGEGCYYSSTNYILLGMIIEKATNSNIAVELRNRFFDPLGLERTYLRIEEPDIGETVHRYFLGIDTAWFPPTSGASFGWTASAIRSTAEDLALWAQALFGGSVIGEAYLEQMLDFTNTGKVYWESEDLVGLGIWAIEHPQFGEIWYHDGATSDSKSLVGYLPDHDIVIVVLLNQRLASPFALWEILADVAIN